MPRKELVPLANGSRAVKLNADYIRNQCIYAYECMRQEKWDRIQFQCFMTCHCPIHLALREEILNLAEVDAKNVNVTDLNTTVLSKIPEGELREEILNNDEDEEEMYVNNQEEEEEEEEKDDDDSSDNNDEGEEDGEGKIDDEGEENNRVLHLWSDNFLRSFIRSNPDGVWMNNVHRSG
jgi:hypothetical protein